MGSILRWLKWACKFFGEQSALAVSKTKHRSSHHSVRKAILRNFAKFSVKHLYLSLFFNEVAALCRATLLKKRPWHKCFPVDSAKFLWTHFLQYISGRLLLKATITKFLEKQFQKQILLVIRFLYLLCISKKEYFILQNLIIVFFPANKQSEKFS